MARDVDTITLVSKSLLDNSYQKELDPNVISVPWQDNVLTSTKKLRIGYYEEDGFFPTTPGIKRSVQLVRQNLEKLGHEFVPFSPPEVEKIVRSFMQIANADGGRSYLHRLSGEEIDSQIRLNRLVIGLPYFVKCAFLPLLKWLSPRLIPFFMGAGGHKVKYSYQLWEEILKKNEYRGKIMNEWSKLKLDFCICPTNPCPAPLSKDMVRLTGGASYTFLQTYIDFPAGVVPVTTENEEDQLLLKGYPETDILLRVVKKSTAGAVGLPLAVQVFGLPWAEETVLRGMKLIESTLQ